MVLSLFTNSKRAFTSLSEKEVLALAIFLRRG